MQRATGRRPARSAHLSEETPVDTGTDEPAAVQPPAPPSHGARHERYGVWVKRWSLADSHSDPDSIDATGRRATIAGPAEPDFALDAEAADALATPPALPDPWAAAAAGRSVPVDTERELRALHVEIAKLRRESRARFTPDTAGSAPADRASGTTRRTPSAPR